jgi:hypothetical protein
MHFDGKGVPNSRQLPIYQHNRARVRIGGRTHRSDVADAGAWGWTSAGMCQEHTSGASVTLSRFEPLCVNAQGFDFRFERLPRQAQLGRRAGWTGYPAAALGQRGFDEGAFVLDTCRH